MSIKYDPLLGRVRESDDPTASVSESDLIETVRLVLNPYHISTHLNTELTGIILSAGVPQKIVLDVNVVGTPSGFDVYAADGGNALRLVGDGIDSGVNRELQFFTQAAVLSTAGAGKVKFYAKTRAYDDLLVNAVDLEGYDIETYVANNQQQAITIVAPDLYNIPDGNIFDIYIASDSSMTISVVDFAFTAKEIGA